MIPLGDASRRPLRFAVVTTLLIAVNLFLTQLFSEVGALAQVQSGGVAYMAHVGGFIFGAVTARIFESASRRGQEDLE
jgi:membrane associated rhomboid family serine protease